MSLGVFIAGRLSSERLPQKLILPIGDSCLWDMACSKLSQLPKDYNKYVLAEKGILVDIASRYKNLEIIERDPETAKADSPLSFIFMDLKQVYENYLMFLNPCQSFLTVKTILASIEMFFSSPQAEYATSVIPLRNWIFRDGESLNEIDYRTLSTKEIKPLWQAAHCFHIFNKANFFNDGYMLKPSHLLIPVPEEEVLDVDTKQEYEFVRWKYEVCV